MKKLYYYSKSIAKFLGIIALLMLLSPLVIKAQDLPNPPVNLETIPAGSFVIPMDTDLQNIVPAGQAPFNLKSYGLVNKLLQSGIPVKWAIASGKQKDGIDFSATAERYAPGVTAAASIDFRGGPFIIPDTVLPCGQSTSQVISSFGNNVVVYRLTNSTTADIRYTLTHRPKIAVFNNGNNQVIHTKILDAAGIDDYDVMSAADIADLANCYTFASEPHADEVQVSQGMIDGVRSFVLNGGNFLAQCAAVEAYENRGFYQTTAGLTIINTTVSQQFPNPDMAFTQMHGVMLENAGGTVDNWTPSAGSVWHPYTYKSVTYNNLDTVVAMGAHLIAPTAPGGNVFYLGGHDYARNGPPSSPPDLSTIGRINALRAYLNVAFIPSGTSSGAWAEAGPPSLSIGCSESVVLGCEQTGPLGSTFLWTPSIGLSCTTCPNPIANPSISTTYTVQVTNGCMAMDTIRVLVGSKPIAQFTNTTVCQGVATSFTDQSVGSTFRRWNFGDPASGSSNASNLANPIHIFSTHGSYSVTLISGTDPLCADTIVQTVVVALPPVVTVASQVICSGETATLTAGGADSYTWSTGETTASISASPNTTTSYTVTGTSQGCSNNVTATVTVIPPFVPAVSSTNVSCFSGNNGTATVSMLGDGIYTYSWNTLPIQTTAQATALSEGTYNVTVTDTNGCTASVAATVSEPPALVLTTSSTDVSCFGGNNGSAAVSVTGGVAPYTYSWNTNPVQLTAQATDLIAANYTVLVTDINGCTASTSTTINEPPTVTISTSVIPVSCYGGSDGSADVSVTGGTPPYLYSWNIAPVQTSALATDLTVGTYTVTVTDDNQCIYTAQATVIEPPAIALIFDSTAVSCFGGSDGSAVVMASGGTPGYSYSWNTNPVQTNFQAIGVSAGTYSVLVTDANGCTNSASVSVTEPDMLNAGVATDSVSCNEGNNGTATVTTSGGTPGYVYSWNTSPVQAMAQAIGLAAGTYSVTITDINGCTTSVAATVSEPPALVLTTSSTDVSCFGGNNGSAAVSVTGGVAPYAYSWNTNPVQLTSQATELIAGNHTVLVTDLHGCTATTSANINEPPTVTLTTSVIPVSCYGGSDGSANVSVTGGASPYLYSWNTVPLQTGTQASGISAGTYTISVTDDNHCVYTAIATVVEPDPILINTSHTNPTCLQGGTASASVTGGNAPYTFQWNSGPVQATSFISNLTAGDYKVFVTDANGCQEKDSITLMTPPTLVADFDYTTNCIGSTSVFTDKSVVQSGPIASSIVSWSWNFGNPTTGTANTATVVNPEHTFDAAAIYQIRLIVTSDLGCKDTIIKPLEVYPVPEVRFGSTGGGCEKVCVTFSDSSSIATGSIQSWAWEFGDASGMSRSTIQNPVHCYDKAGSYNIRLTVTSDRGCSASSFRENMIGVYSNPVVELGPDQKICTEDNTERQLSIQTILNAGPGSEFSWTPTGENAQTIKVTQPGIYTLTITNEWGCKGSDLINLKEVCPPRLFVSNAFSPDRDAINDLYNVHSAHVGKFQMLIFNRWGEIIFESRDKNHFWDGIYRDEPMPIGVYPWIIVYEGDSEEYQGPYRMEGSVTVVR